MEFRVSRYIKKDLMGRYFIKAMDLIDACRIEGESYVRPSNVHGFLY